MPSTHRWQVCTQSWRTCTQGRVCRHSRVAPRQSQSAREWLKPTGALSPPSPSPLSQVPWGWRMPLNYMHTRNVHMLSDTWFHQRSTTMCHLGSIHLRSELLKSNVVFGRIENCITLGLNVTRLMPCSCHITFAVVTGCWMGKRVNVIGSNTLDIGHFRWQTWH